MLCHRSVDILHGRTDFGGGVRLGPIAGSSDGWDATGAVQVVGMVQTDQQTRLYADAVRLVTATDDPGMFPQNPTGNLTIGSIRLSGGSLAYGLAFELLAAAVFDRELTDDEIARASQELAG